MRNSILHIIAAISGLMTACLVNAQSINSLYFLDNNSFNYRISPSIAGEKGFASIALGSIEFGASCNLGLSNLLFPNPSGDGLITGFNKAVSVNDFIGALPKSTSLSVDGGINLFALGFWEGNSFWNFEINLRNSESIAVPSSVFEFLKCGNGRYDLSNLSLSSTSYGEIALGASIPVNEKLKFGFRAKALIGLAAAKVNFSDSYFDIGGSAIEAKLNGQLTTAIHGLSFDTKISERTGKEIIDFTLPAYDVNQLGIGGYGAAIDLGVSYYPREELELTAALNNIGFINWRQSMLANASSYVSFEGIDLTTDSNDIEKELLLKLENLTEITEFENVDSENIKYRQSIPFNAYLGAKYHIPIFANRVAISALYNYRAADGIKYNDIRAGITLTPLNWLSVSANAGRNTHGSTCGAAASVTLLGFNFMLGFDGYLGSYAKADINLDGSQNISIPYPINAFRYSVKAGVSLTFGKRHNVYINE